MEKLMVDLLLLEQEHLTWTDIPVVLAHLCLHPFCQNHQLEWDWDHQVLHPSFLQAAEPV
jgi:hypothetical protein